MASNVLEVILYVVTIVMAVYAIFVLWKLHMSIKKSDRMLEELREKMETNE